MKRKCLYQKLRQEIYRFSVQYPEITKVFCLAKTADGNRIYVLRVGNPKAKRQFVIQAAMHAREWLNTELLLLQIREACQRYSDGRFAGKRYCEWLLENCFWVVPMVNPDGVAISQAGAGMIRNTALRELVCNTAGSRHKIWKANARGVDLNRNFNIGFAQDTAESAGAQNYAGSQPFSERETRALIKLVRMVSPVAVISYHETGHVIYYQESESLAKQLRQMTGYRLCREGGPANGNFGDWLTEEGIDWCTLETCIGKAPAGKWQLTAEWRGHRNLFWVLAKFYEEV